MTRAGTALADTSPRENHAFSDALRLKKGRLGSMLNLFGAPLMRQVQKVAVEETRLGIPLFFGFDVVHGHRTVFPIPLAEAAAFDPALWAVTS